MSQASFPFQNDYHYMLDVLANRRPVRLPVYEHIISPFIMEEILGVPFAGLQFGDDADLDEFFHHYGRFFQQMTYDTVPEYVPVEGYLAMVEGARRIRMEEAR